jgi:hypothetical protein
MFELQVFKNEGAWQQVPCMMFLPLWYLNE